jgi:hypothetical protein
MSARHNAGRPRPTLDELRAQEDWSLLSPFRQGTVEDRFRDADETLASLRRLGLDDELDPLGAFEKHLDKRWKSVRRTSQQDVEEFTKAVRDELILKRGELFAKKLKAAIDADRTTLSRLERRELHHMVDAAKVEARMTKLDAHFKRIYRSTRIRRAVAKANEHLLPIALFLAFGVAPAIPNIQTSWIGRMGLAAVLGGVADVVSRKLRPVALRTRRDAATSLALWINGLSTATALLTLVAHAKGAKQDRDLPTPSSTPKS